MARRSQATRHGAIVNPGVAPVGYGIDFRTSISIISVAYPDHVEVVALGDRDPR
jgi:hypothetical protein